jgi:predicted nucleic acid-binding protein
MIRRRAQGRPIADLDAQIAAIAQCCGAILATRNSADFEGCGIRLVNPWQP